MTKDTSIEALLRTAGFDNLGHPPTADQIESVIRALASALDGADVSRVAIARHEAIGRLTKLGVADADVLVKAALARPAGFSLREAPPSEEPVDGEVLADLLAWQIRRFLVIDEPGLTTVVLWLVFTHTIAAFDIAPILGISSPTMRCGKSTLLYLINELACRPLMTSNITPSALSRVIDLSKPTLIIDEADTFMGGNEELRGLLNAGHTRGSAFVTKNVWIDGDWQPKQFNVWGPKAVAKIGQFRGTVADRSIVVPLRRRHRGEKNDRLRQARLRDELAPLPSMLVRWAADQREALRDTDPVVPDELSDRAQDNWRPLLAIAQKVGGEWPDRGRRAAIELQRVATQREEVSEAEALLGDVRRVLENESSDKIGSADLLQRLSMVEDSQWQGMSARRMSALLSEFEIAPRGLRVGQATLRGYRIADFRDAFQRYLSADSATGET